MEIVSIKEEARPILISECINSFKNNLISVRDFTLTKSLFNPTTSIALNPFSGITSLTIKYLTQLALGRDKLETFDFSLKAAEENDCIERCIAELGKIQPQFITVRSKNADIIRSVALLSYMDRLYHSKESNISNGKMPVDKAQVSGEFIKQMQDIIDIAFPPMIQNKCKPGITSIYKNNTDNKVYRADPHIIIDDALCIIKAVPNTITITSKDVLKIGAQYLIAENSHSLSQKITKQGIYFLMQGALYTAPYYTNQNILSELILGDTYLPF